MIGIVNRKGLGSETSPSGPLPSKVPVRWGSQPKSVSTRGRTTEVYLLQQGCQLYSRGCTFIKIAQCLKQVSDYPMKLLFLVRKNCLETSLESSVTTNINSNGGNCMPARIKGVQYSYLFMLFTMALRQW